MEKAVVERSPKRTKPKLWELYRLIVTSLVGLVSFLFVVSVFIPFVLTSHPISVWLIFLIGVVVCSAVNFFLSKKFPKSFYSWDILDPAYKDSKNPLSFPPFTAIPYSIGLTIFVLSFFFDSVRKVWQGSLAEIDEIYREVGAYWVLLPIFAMILFPLLTGLIGLAGRFLFQAKSSVEKALISLLYFVGLAVWFYVLFVGGGFVEQSMPFVIQVLKFLVGSIPLYWFYRLFTGSKRTRRF